MKTENLKHQKQIHRQKSIKKNKRRIKSKSKRGYKLNLLNGIKRIYRRSALKMFKNAHKYILVKCPENFSFVNNTNEFCRFIEKVESLKPACSKRGLLFNMVKCRDIDFSGLSVLFLMLYNLKLNNIKVNGYNPEDIKLRLYLNGMEFFETLLMIDKKYENIQYNLGDDSDRITIKGDSSVIPRLGLTISRYLSKKLFKDETHINDGLQRILLELMSNTTTWSDQKIEKNLWILTIYYNQEDNSMHFAFADYGIGILNSIKNSAEHSKWLSNFNVPVFENTDCNIFKSMLNGDTSKYKSSTGHYFRGKGIPSLKKAISNNYINNLQIITNGVYSNVELDVFSPIESEFSGTFVTWTINDKNNFYINEEIFN
ncbi:hypothetical protein [Elizabethkingia anophelis]|uniref:hypothetical protein n=1 Tax=Elizabethkingia anophelis TaxID=1117645 RepID=UPI00136921E3|nr:hypothetical protein [Elizabethkingia anophelis]MYY44182.1 hypothetical protein [Elizabethkingia anophelis]